MMVNLMAYFNVMQHLYEQIFQAEISPDALIKWKLVARHGSLFCQLILEKYAIKA
jgi:hypothetical protein